MKIKILHYVEKIFSTFWFLPTLIVGMAILLSVGTVALDEAPTGHWLQTQGWIYTGGVESASTVLGAIAGSMITIAGVVFSMTLVTLSLASSQFGSRLLRNFMRDKPTQVVLGVFVATFLYCLLVLRTLRREGVDGSSFVPHLSVTIGIIMAVASIGVLIYFIHHVAASIQADKIITRVYLDIVDGIDHLFPEKMGEEIAIRDVENDNQRLPTNFNREARQVEANSDGYVQSIDTDGLLGLSVEKDLLIRIERRPGHYVVTGTPLVSIWPGLRVTEELTAKINSIFIRGHQRTSTQDVEHSANQLVEIAVRALSPGVNDPFTAVSCVDRLGSALCRLAQRNIPSPYRFDKENKLRVIAACITFPALANIAFNQIRQFSRTSAALTICLLKTIILIAPKINRQQDRAALRLHVEMIARGGREGIPEEQDRRTVQQFYEEAIRKLHPDGDNNNGLPTKRETTGVQTDEKKL